MPFDLLAQPWIPLQHLTRNGTTEVNLLTALKDARSYRRLVGSTPTMTAALHRLLLAFAHRACGPATMEAWAELWHRTDGFPEGPLMQYAAQHRGAFDLFDPERPFFQCPALAALDPKSIAPLVSFRSGGNNRTFFDHTLDTDRPLLEPAEAARWLVTVQMYDTGGNKTPHRGKASKSSTKGLGNDFGCVLVEGRNLYETLLLNAVRYDPKWELPNGLTSLDDRPVWEEGKPPPPEPDERQARGWTDLLTWPSRRVLLHTRQIDDRVWVDGVRLTPGTKLTTTQLNDIELMAAFREDKLRKEANPKPGKKADKQPNPLRAIRLRPVEGAWRYARSLLLSDDPRWFSGRASAGLTRYEPRRQRPYALDHIAEVVGRGHIDESTVYTLRIFGQNLLPGKLGAIATWHEESVLMPVALLRAQDASLGSVIGVSTDFADDVAQALHTMVTTYGDDFNAKYDFKGHVSFLEDKYWPSLAAPFDHLLRTLAEALRADRPTRPAFAAWGDTVTRIANQVANDWVHGADRRQRTLLHIGHARQATQLELKTARNLFEDGLNKYLQEAS